MEGRFVGETVLAVDGWRWRAWLQLKLAGVSCAPLPDARKAERCWR